MYVAEKCSGELVNRKKKDIRGLCSSSTWTLQRKTNRLIPNGRKNTLSILFSHIKNSYQCFKPKVRDYNFLNGSSAGVFSPENCIAPLSNFAAKRSKDSPFLSYHTIENPPKRPGSQTDPRVFERSKCVARFTRTSQKPSRWLPLFDWMSLTKWLNNNWFKADLVSDYCLTTTNQKEAISGTVSGWHVWIWLARVNLTTHLDRLKTVGF